MDSRLPPLSPLPTYLFFQFHWMDSQLRVWAARPHVLHLSLSIPLNGFRGLVLRGALRTAFKTTFNSIEWIRVGLRKPTGSTGGIYFQFHWMDSWCLNLSVATLLYSFQFHWMDSNASIILPKQWASYGGFQFHWMDSPHIGYHSQAGTRHLSIPLNGFFNI